MKFKHFINESPVIDQKYKKEFESLGAKIKYKDRYKELFKDSDRIYLPVPGSVDVRPMDFDLDIYEALNKRVSELENKYKVRIIPYENITKNLIEFRTTNTLSNLALFDDMKRKEKLSYTFNEFIKLYGNEAEKSQISTIPRIGTHDKIKVVISRNPCDIGSMSTGTHWSSCMNLYNGMYNKYTRYDVMYGTLIAYLIDEDDKEIEKPIGRKLIKPYINYGEKTRKELLVLTKPTYGIFTPEAEKVVEDWLNEHQKDIEGYFKLHSSLYKDDDVTTIKKGK